MGRTRIPDRSEDAVSPVIGIILMVAVTVVLAAVIAAFTFGAAVQVKKVKIIDVQASQMDDDILLTYMGSVDDPRLLRLDVTVTEADGTETIGSFPNMPPTVGDTLTLPDAGSPGKDHVVVVAELIDGSKQVVLDVAV